MSRQDELIEAGRRLLTNNYRQSPVVMARRSSDASVLPPGLEIRYGALEDSHLNLEGIDTLVYCASMGFGHLPHLVSQLERAGMRRAVFVSTTAVFTSLPSASRAVRLAAETAVKESRLDWTILRPTMIYGTGRDRNPGVYSGLRRWTSIARLVGGESGHGVAFPIDGHDVRLIKLALVESARGDRQAQRPSRQHD